MNKKNILYITQYSELYGANRSLLSLISQRKIQGFSDLVVLPVPGSFEDVLKDLDIEYLIEPYLLSYHIPSTRKQIAYRFVRWGLNLLFRVHSYFSQRRASINIVNKIKNSNFTLIHSNSSLQEVGHYISTALKLPHVWHIREFGDLDYSLYYNFSLVRRKRLLSSATKCIFVGEKLLKHFNYSEEENGIIIRNGVLPADLAENIDWEKEKNDLLIVGYLNPTKGQVIAIKAFSFIHKHYPNKKLHIVGEGCQKFRAELDDLVEELDLTNSVIFHGFQSEVSTFYLQSKYTLMCSPNEAMGRVTPEAFAHGSVVIGIDNAGTSEMVSHEKTGMLFKSEALELANIILELETKDDDYYALRSSARDEFMQNYTEEKYFQKVSEVYKKSTISAIDK